jgi:hypothetical protein
MQEKFKSDPEFAKLNLTVTSVAVVKQGENRFEGLAQIQYKGTSHDVSVGITADGQNQGRSCS